jgi:hypothetical protein
LDKIPKTDSGASADLPPAGTRSVKELLGNPLFDKYGPGLHFDIPPEEYFQIPAVSNSSLGYARQSFRHFQKYIEQGVKEATPAMEWGRIAHLCLLEHERFKNECVISVFEDKRAAGYKKFCKDNPGKTILTKKQANMLTTMFEELSRNAGCMELIKDGRAEVTALAIDPITGLRLKGRFDFWPDSKPYILDYKTTGDAKPTLIPEKLEATEFLRSSKFERNANELGYEHQGAFYLYLAELLGHKRDYYAVIAQETDEFAIACPYVYGFETIEEAANENRSLLNRIKDCLLTGKFPGYSEKPVILARPSYARTK